MKRTISLMCCWIACLSWSSGTWGADLVGAVSAAYERAREQARIIPIQPVGGRSIVVDGRLGEWADFDRTAAAIYQNGTLPSCVGLPGRRDKAQVGFMTAHDILYVGVRVKDDSVFHPGGAGNRFAGDSVRLFLDVRLPDAAEKLLSSGAYSDGVYDFQVAPPTEDGQPAAFRQNAQPGRRAGPIPIASAKQKDGYTVERAIPLPSVLDSPTAGRFQQPFGSEVLVLDADKPVAAGSGGPLLAYSWGSFAEDVLASAPPNFACTDYVPNRLPEIRALVDTTPAAIAVDYDRKRQRVTGFGGNIFRDAEPGPHGGGSVPGQFGPGRPGTLYIAKHLTPAWITLNISLYNWVNPGSPKPFGTWTPDMWTIGDRVAAKAIASMDGTPIDLICCPEGIRAGVRVFRRQGCLLGGVDVRPQSPGLCRLPHVHGPVLREGWIPDEASARRCGQCTRFPVVRGVGSHPGARPGASAFCGRPGNRDHRRVGRKPGHLPPVGRSGRLHEPAAADHQFRQAVQRVYRLPVRRDAHSAAGSAGTEAVGADHAAVCGRKVRQMGHGLGRENRAGREPRDPGPANREHAGPRGGCAAGHAFLVRQTVLRSDASGPCGADGVGSSPGAGDRVRGAARRTRLPDAAHQQRRPRSRGRRARTAPRRQAPAPRAQRRGSG